MAGTANSGRRSMPEELLRHQTSRNINALTDIAVSWATKVWSKLTPYNRIKILLALAPKYIKQEVQTSGEMNIVINIAKPTVTEDELSSASSSVFGIRTPMATSN